ncbi:MAG: FAD-dependent oxidoreductase [Anaerolineae bacterium]|jgi:protoporphyrinogen oxidase|nr:FAD-dependent oxidoreductase [Anaerolineae bacterium]MDH7475592.1 FAD-dependent oxidoreductase [Anaerolineae bacterium]
MSEKVAILGGGLAGLSAAWKLAQAGFEVDVLEALSRVGGLAASFQRGGFIFDYGPHRFHTKNDELLAEVRGLVGDELLGRHRKTTVYFMNRYFDYPLTGSNLLRNLPPSLAVLCFFDFLSTWIRGRIAPKIDDSFESWVVNRFGRRLYDIYFGPYTAKVWGNDPTQLSSSWAAQRVAVVDLWDLIKHTLGINTRPPDEFEHSPYLIDFHYPRYGIGCLPQRLAEEIRAHGGRIHLNSRVVTVEHADGRARSVSYLHAGELQNLAADYVVSSIPINILVRSMQPSAPSVVLRAADRLQYRAMVFLYLMLDKPRVTDDHWIYFPAKEDIFNRISEIRNFSEDTVPDGQTSLCVEITCNEGDHLWSTPNHELFEQSVESLVRAGLIRPEEIMGYFVRRMTHAYPTYDLDFEEKLNQLTGFLHNFENVLSIGRQGLFRYFNMDHAMETGFQAAEKIMSGALREKVIQVGQEQVWFG